MLISIIYHFFKGIKPMTNFEFNKKITNLYWAKNHASPEDKVIANEKFKTIVINLYEEYVNSEGSTYYPPMQQDLWRDFQNNICFL
tara:strand:+ start:57 stop:314 length:258 start_codon:yes stop_codon:yes gene_type:complete